MSWDEVARPQPKDPVFPVPGVWEQRGCTPACTGDSKPRGQGGLPRGADT